MEVVYMINNFAIVMMIVNLVKMNKCVIILFVQNQLCGRDLNAVCKVKPYFNYSFECKKGFKYDQDSRSCLGNI